MRIQDEQFQTSEGRCPKCRQPLDISGTCYGCALEHTPEPRSTMQAIFDHRRQCALCLDGQECDVVRPLQDAWIAELRESI